MAWSVVAGSGPGFGQRAVRGGNQGIDLQKAIGVFRFGRPILARAGHLDEADVEIGEIGIPRRDFLQDRIFGVGVAELLLGDGFQPERITRAAFAVGTSRPGVRGPFWLRPIVWLPSVPGPFSCARNSCWYGTFPNQFPGRSPAACQLNDGAWRKEAGSLGRPPGAFPGQGRARERRRGSGHRRRIAFPNPAAGPCGRRWPC